MKVVHLIDALRWGGAQTLLLTFTKTAQQFGVETVVVGVKPDHSDSPLPEMLKDAGARVIVNRFNKLYDPRAVPTISQFLDDEKVDIIQTHLSHANIYGCMAAKIAHIPSVATLHNTKVGTKGRLGVRNSVEQFCLRNGATRVIAVGQNVASAFSHIVEESRIDIIPNAVTLGVQITADEQQAIRDKLTGSPECPLLITVGRLTEQKGYGNLLTAFAQVIKSHPDAMLVIIGTGELDATLKQQAATLGLENRVHFPGSRSDVPCLLAASDVFVNSSLWEGLSIAMLEAMAAGLPIVATRVGDAEKLISSGSGLLVEEGNIDGIAKALIYMLDNPQERVNMGQFAREFVKKNYSAHAWFKKLLKTYALARESLS